MSAIAYGVAAWLFLVGVAGVVRSNNLIHMVICLTVAQASTYVLLLAIGYRDEAAAPIVTDIGPGSRVVDPVVQAMTLTDIVVEATVVALLLSLAVRAAQRFETLDPDEIATLRK